MVSTGVKKTKRSSCPVPVFSCHSFLSAPIISGLTGMTHEYQSSGRYNFLSLATAAFLLCLLRVYQAWEHPALSSGCVSRKGRAVWHKPNALNSSGYLSPGVGYGHLEELRSVQVPIFKGNVLKNIPVKRIYDMPTVRVFNGDLEKALKRFNRRVRSAGIIGILKDRRLRPTGAMRRRHKRKAAVARLKKL